ncbi:MAG TPA: hypothetical protein VHK86_03880, partial [Nitrososphaera sp.]|nr:hypothetical protein [Nitrososphaera sp.]
EAYGELQTLGEEMREAYDNTPESLQNSGVGEARGEAADNLENISEPNVPEELMGDKFTFKFNSSTKKKTSRSDRRYEAVETLQAVSAFLGDIEENRDGKYSKEEVQAASDFVQDIDQMVDEAEAVDFPGMYG